MVEGDKVCLVIDGQQVEGQITSLRRNDMTVRITSPHTEISTVLHVPHFAMVSKENWLCDEEGQITPRGIERAETLLKEIYTIYQKQQVAGDLELSFWPAVGEERPALQLVRGEQTFKLYMDEVYALVNALNIWTPDIFGLVIGDGEYLEWEDQQSYRYGVPSPDLVTALTKELRTRQLDAPSLTTSDVDQLLGRAARAVLRGLAGPQISLKRELSPKDDRVDHVLRIAGQAPLYLDADDVAKLRTILAIYNEHAPL
jgi:hypothetical protein